GDFALAWAVVTPEERARPDYSFTRLRYAVADLYEASPEGFGSLMLLAGGTFAFTSTRFTDARTGPGFGTVPPGKTFTFRAYIPVYRTVLRRASLLVCSPPILVKSAGGEQSWRYFIRFSPRDQHSLDTFAWKQTELVPLTPTYLHKLVGEPGRDI